MAPMTSLKVLWFLVIDCGPAAILRRLWQSADPKISGIIRYHWTANPVSYMLLYLKIETFYRFSI